MHFTELCWNTLTSALMCNQSLGIEILNNEPMDHPKYGKCQYTKKIYHVARFELKRLNNTHTMRSALQQ